MFQFAHPKFLIMLILIPVLLGIFIISRFLRAKSLKSFGDPALVDGLIPEASVARPWVKFILAITALGLVIIALAGPQFGTKLRDVKRKGIELVIALDVSNSMMAEDITPCRLENAKRAISKLIDELHNDKLALIVFAGDAFVQVPMTSDYSAAKMFLSSINPSLVSNQGTAIASAIELGMKSFSPGDEKNKAIVIITDGEDHEGDAVGMATKANEAGIIVHTIGMGLPNGAPIPVTNANGQRDYRTDNTGSVVISKLDETTLKQVAAAGGGKYIRANNTKSGLSALFEELNQMQKVEMESKIYSEYEEQYQYFLGFAILLIFIEFIILQKQNKKLNAINLFKNSMFNLKK
jgi:Ca-activated chloride channel family protein